MYTRRSLLKQVAVASATAALGTGLVLGTSACAAKPVNHRVEIKGFKFIPENLTVRPGDTITWINMDIAPHTATATDKSWDTGILRKGEMKTITVTKGMSLPYYCFYHPSMKAGLKLASGN